MVKVVEEASGVGRVLDCKETLAPICGGAGDSWQGNENCREDEYSKAYEDHVNRKFGGDRKIRTMTD